MSSTYLEGDLSAPTRDIHRALASLQEELEAVDYYQQRAEQAQDEELKALLLHNRREEVEHAAMLFEWLRRHAPDFAEQAKTYLFTEGPLTEIEEGEAGAPDAAKDPGRLNLGDLS